jgi:Ca2+-transporting ATPase
MRNNIDFVIKIGGYRVTKYYSMDVKDVATDLDVNISEGLKYEEVEGRIKTYGTNSLKESKGKTLFQMVIEQFKSFIVLILIAASVLSIAIDEIVDGAVILGIVILNAVLGIIQEKKASNALSALKEMAAPRAKVIRDGKISTVESKELVPGDIVVLEAGDYVPADIRLVESINLKIDESALTGESVAVEKNADNIYDEEIQIADRDNCAYMSTIVTYGRGKGIVTGTSMNTEIGKIASMLNEAVSEETPLQKKLDSFGKLLGIVCILVCVIIFILGVIRNEDTLTVLMTSVSLAVAAIPEGLPAVV